MDLDSVDKGVEKAERIAPRLWHLVWSNWKLWLVLTFGYLCYWFFGLVNEEIKNPQPATQEPTQDAGVWINDTDTTYTE